MADYIDRLLKNLEEFKGTEWFKQGGHYEIYVRNGVLSKVVDIIKSMPSVDAVEVVRCKDCKYCNDGVCDQVTYYHQKWGISTQYVNDDDYCKWGEKNEVN